MQPKPPNTLLPPDAVAALQKAATTPNPPSDPLFRQKLIEQTTRRIQQQYPQFFNIKEIQNEAETQ